MNHTVDCTVRTVQSGGRSGRCGPRSAADDPTGPGSAQALTGLDEEALALPRARRRTLVGLVAALATGQVRLGPGRAGLDDLAALPGIGPWTVESVAMRGLGDPDAFLPTDLGIVLAAKALRLPPGARALTERAQAWRPYRAYAVQHLWATGTHPVNRLPADG